MHVWHIRRLWYTSLFHIVNHILLSICPTLTPCHLLRHGISWCQVHIGRKWQFTAGYCRLQISYQPDAPSEFWRGGNHLVKSWNCVMNGPGTPCTVCRDGNDLYQDRDSVACGPETPHTVLTLHQVISISSVLDMDFFHTRIEAVESQ
jgi:hypothetical protein